MAYDNLVAKVTVVGDIASCIAVAVLLVLCLVLPRRWQLFSNPLILNLALAEFFNSLNNSISGFIYVRTRRLRPGPACTVNGFFNQITAQAIDFTMLAIVITTLLTVTRRMHLPAMSSGKKWMVCVSTWAMPISTSILAVALRSVAPVSGNWCWVSAERPELQYALAHGWRLAIIFTIVLLFIYTGWFVLSRFRIRSPSIKRRSIHRCKSGSETPGTLTILLNEKRVSESPDRRDSMGWCLPIQKHGSSEKGQSRTVFTLFPRRQIGHLNSLYNLGLPPRLYSLKDETWPTEKEIWLQEILNISRCTNPVSKSLESCQTPSDSSGSGPNLLIQLPEVPIVHKPFDLWEKRCDTPPPDESAITGAPGPSYHNQCPKVTKEFQVSVDHEETVPGSETPKILPTDLKPGPNYHNQCPKVTKSFQISVDEEKTARESMSSEAVRTGPNYHNQCPKVIRTVQVSTDPVATPTFGSSETSGPHYHNQCPKVTRTINVSTDRIATPAFEGAGKPGPNYHNQCPKVIRTVDVSTSDPVGTPTFGSSSRSGPHYHSQCPKVTRTINVSMDPVATSVLSSAEKSGPNYHNQCPKVTRTINVTTDQRATTPVVDDKGPKPNYHNQCPKVTRSFNVSTDQATTLPPLHHETPGPNYHNQCPKVTRSFNVSTDEAELSPLHHEAPGPNYHNQCPKVTRSFNVSTDQATTLPPLHHETAGPNYHNQCPKVTRTIAVSTSQSPSPLPPSTGSPGPQYHQQCPKVQRSFGLTVTKNKEQSKDESGPRYHNQCPKVTRSVEVSSSQPGPNYHSECPLVKKTVSVSVDPKNNPDTNTDEGPRYHNQCPKVIRSVEVSSSQSGPNYHSECPLVKKSVSISVDSASKPDVTPDTSPRYRNQFPRVRRSLRISPSGSAVRPTFEAVGKPLPPSPVRLPQEFKTETTILTSPMAPPPSPTPGLPPPPWSQTGASPTSRIQFKRPGFLSKSSWSESTRSSRIPDHITLWARRPHPHIPNKIKSITEDFCRHFSSGPATAGYENHNDDNDTDNDDDNSSNSSSTSPPSENEMRRSLLLNAYPLAYIILWLPAVANRFLVIGGGHPADSRAMDALQTCTQLIPFANALTFGVIACLRWRTDSESFRARASGHASSKRSWWPRSSV